MPYWFYNVGGRLLLELNRVLRPGGYFVWSATPVYQKNPEDSGIWKGKVLFIQVCGTVRNYPVGSKLFYFLQIWVKLQSQCAGIWWLLGRTN